MQYLLDLPTAKFVILCICLLILATIALLGFGGELVQLAKAKIAQKKDNESDSDKLDYIKELLLSKNEALHERIDNTEKSVERIERNIEGLIKKMDDGFLGVYQRLNDHIDRDQAILAKSYTGQERRGSAR